MNDPDPLKTAFTKITELLESLDIHIVRMELDRRRKRLERDPHERTYLDVEPDF